MSNVTPSPLAVQTSPRLAEVIPPKLAALKRWTAWSVIPPKKPGAKLGKKPLSLTNDGSTWLTLPDALTAAARLPAGGVGFQLFGVTSIVGIDLDACVDPATGAVSEFAAALLAALPVTYAEVTPSGKGLRLFATLADAQQPPPEFLNHEAGVECYVGRSARFLTVTGQVLPGREGLLQDLTPEAHRLLARVAGKGAEITDVEIPLPLPETPRIEDWKKIFDRKRGVLEKNLMVFLETGEVPGSRSEKQFAVATWMISRNYSPEEVYTVLHSAPGSWEAALDKRDQDPGRARALIWSDIGRAQKIVRVEVAEAEGQADAWAAVGLHVEVIAKKLRVVMSQSNAARMVEHHETWRGRLALDITTGEVLLDGVALDDARLFELQERVSKFCQWAPNSSRTWWGDVLRSVAAKNPINPREAWLRSIPWDGKPRLDTWMNQRMAAEPDALTAQLGRKWLIGLVARWIDPGCKLDTVLVLRGEQGTRKSTFFEVMAGGPEHVVDLEGFSRDDKYVMAKSWIVEMPEAHILKRADNNKLKGFITKRTDDYRIPYASAPVTVRRGFVFVSTANPGSLFQIGQDGLRRWWLVDVRDSKIDLKWITENRDQLLAEAVVAYDLEEQWWFDETPEALKSRVEAAVEDSVVDEAIARLVLQRVGRGGMGLNEICSEVTAMVGFRPSDKFVSMLLPRHGVMPKRTATERFWMHPKWVVKEGSNVINLPVDNQTLAK